MNKLKFVINLSLGVLFLSTTTNAEVNTVYIYTNDRVVPNNAPLQIQPAIDIDKLGQSYEQGRSIKRAWEERKARKKHDKAMEDLAKLDLSDSQAVIDFAKKYPEEVDSLKAILNIYKNIN